MLKKINKTDDLYKLAVSTVIESGRASPALLQRKLKIGYARSARLIDLLEDKGVIGPAEGAKPRLVLIEDILDLVINEEELEETEVTDDDEASRELTYEKVPKNEKLTERQELFCVYFAQDRDCFGIGVRAYMAAYPKAMYDSAKSNAYQLLTNTYILERIDKLMEIFMSDQVADKELNFVIIQKGNLNAKVRAINERNKVRGRIIDRHAIGDLKDIPMDKFNPQIAKIYGRSNTKKDKPTTEATKGRQATGYKT